MCVLTKQTFKRNISNYFKDDIVTICKYKEAYNLIKIDIDFSDILQLSEKQVVCLNSEIMTQYLKLKICFHIYIDNYRSHTVYGIIYMKKITYITLCPSFTNISIHFPKNSKCNDKSSKLFVII